MIENVQYSYHSPELRTFEKAIREVYNISRYLVNQGFEYNFETEDITGDFNCKEGEVIYSHKFNVDKALELLVSKGVESFNMYSQFAEPDYHMIAVHLCHGDLDFQVRLHRNKGNEGFPLDKKLYYSRLIFARSHDDLDAEYDSEGNYVSFDAGSPELSLEDKKKFAKLILELPSVIKGEADLGTGEMKNPFDYDIPVIEEVGK